MAYLLGVDLGTSGTKTVLFDQQGNTVASALSEYPMYQPQIGWAEQDPEDWYNATVITIKQVIEKSGVDPSEIKAMGIAGQMHGMVLLGSEGEVLRKSIIWCDQRTSLECEQITELVGAERLIEITANPALTGFTASKIMWVKNNQPEIFEKTCKVLLPKDYVRFRLTGVYATEVSDASGMQLLDVPKRQWSKEVTSKLGIPFEWLAPVYESYEVSGNITKDIAKITGLVENMPVVGGAGDQAAGGIGNGIVKEGIVSSTIGTSGVVFAHSNKVSIDPKGRLQTFCHAVPGCWHIMGVTQAAGYSYQWFRNQFCSAEMTMAKRLGIDPYELMGQQAEQAKPGCSGLIYLPYVMGERAPHLDSVARGVFFGLSSMHGRNEMIRSVMEGVSYSLLDCMNIIRDMGVNPSEVRASGGGGKSPLWRQMQADMFDTPIATVNSSEGPALGVALLAGVGVGIYDSVQQACEMTIVSKISSMPIKENTATYAKFYEVYRDLYPQLKPSYDKLAKILS